RREVLDTFFLQIVDGKAPTIAHSSLALLSGSMRINKILTTNFDSLIEDAFLKYGDPITVFDVHVETGIPDQQLLIGHRSIVKLHGGRYGLRADYSLDEIPSENDRQNFLSYVLGRPLTHSEFESSAKADAQRLRGGWRI
ncbi:MAG: SIR2 family protein, partial [Myxococcota bacterium]